MHKGSVKISILSSGGEERILDILRAGDTFGEIFLGREKLRAATARALTDAIVWTMVEEKFMEFVRLRPDLCLMEVDEPRGFMKVVVDTDSGQILGCAILSIAGGEVMSMVEIAMMGRLPYTALRDAIFAHPTLAEALNNLFDQ